MTTDVSPRAPLPDDGRSAPVRYPRPERLRLPVPLPYAKAEKGAI